ncbi:AAA family ATPase [Desulfuromonas thiophila]|mgnify:FL=1|uniref:AAA family ATPase n=1 Tax=Desulfuromonas thiophila TaxID=57664 RepID=UPI0024A92417|nr:AAA family ATPase [Desulfuromonas thiophila]
MGLRLTTKNIYSNNGALMQNEKNSNETDLESSTSRLSNDCTTKLPKKNNSAASEHKKPVNESGQNEFQISSEFDENQKNKIKEELQRKYLPLLKKLMSNINTENICSINNSWNLPVIAKAFDKITSYTNAMELVEFATALFSKAESLEEGKMGLFLRSVAQADPALFLSYCHTGAVSAEKLVGFHNALVKELKKKLSSRDRFLELLAMQISLSIIAPSCARTPILIGPPGTGKSMMAQLVSEALTAIGCPSETLFINMGQNSARDNSEGITLKMLGTQFQYSNSCPGMVFESVSSEKTRFTILVLDEADKADHRNTLIGLLDPKNPLQDYFISQFAPKMDMNRKLIKILTANSESYLNDGGDDPLWSRLVKLEVPPYSTKEKELILTSIIKDNNFFNCTKEEIQKVVEQIVAMNDRHCGVREIISLGIETMTAMKLGIDLKFRDQIDFSRKKRIGF